MGTQFNDGEVDNNQNGLINNSNNSNDNSQNENTGSEFIMKSIFNKAPSTPDIKRNLDFDDEFIGDENNEEIDAIAAAFKKSWVSCMNTQDVWKSDEEDDRQGLFSEVPAHNEQFKEKSKKQKHTQRKQHGTTSGVIGNVDDFTFSFNYNTNTKDVSSDSNGLSATPEEGAGEEEGQEGGTIAAAALAGEEIEAEEGMAGSASDTSVTNNTTPTSHTESADYAAEMDIEPDNWNDPIKINSNKAKKSKAQKLVFGSASYEVHTNPRRRGSSIKQQPEELLNLLQKYQWDNKTEPRAASNTNTYTNTKNSVSEQVNLHSTSPEFQRSGKSTSIESNNNEGFYGDNNIDFPNQLHEELRIRQNMNPRSSFSSISINEPSTPLLAQAHIPRQSISSVSSSYRMSPRLSKATDERSSTFSNLHDTETVKSIPTSEDMMETLDKSPSFEWNLSGYSIPSFDYQPIWCTTYEKERLNNIIQTAVFLKKQNYNSKFIVCYSSYLLYEDSLELSKQDNIFLQKLENVPIKLKQLDDLELENSIDIPDLLPFQLYQHYNNQPVLYVPSNVLFGDDFLQKVYSSGTEAVTQPSGTNTNQLMENENMKLGQYIDNENCVLEIFSIPEQSPIFVFKPNEDLFICLCEYLTCYNREKYQRLLDVHGGYEILHGLFGNKIKKRL